MKKILKNIIVILTFPLLFTSCLKDKELIGPDAEGAIKNVIEFKNISTITSPATAPFPVYVPTTLNPEKSTEVIVASIRYAGVDNAPNDITVELGVDPSIVNKYNSAQKTNFLALPNSAYELPSSVTIKKGEKEVSFEIKLNINSFDQLKENVLPIIIKSTSSAAPISGNFGKVIYSFPIRSIWEGTYKYTIINNFGTIDGNIGGTFTEEGVKLSTVGPNKVRMNGLWQTYSGYSEYQFNASNSSITSVTAFSGSNLATSIQEVVLVDPVKMIFEIKWTGLGRGVIERFEKTGD